MKDSGKLITAALILSVIALFSNFLFGREVIPMLNEDMKVWVGQQSQGARDWLSAEEMDIMVSLMQTQKAAESGEDYGEFVLAFGATENDVQAMNMSLYRRSNGTNEFMLKYPNGKCYSVATRQVLQLLTSDTLDNLLDYIEDAPTMTVTQGENSLTVHCVENGWQYKKIDNSIFMDGVLVKDPTRLIEVDDYTDLQLSFSTEPHSVRVSVSFPATGQTVFEGPATELEHFSPPFTGVYQMTVTARWSESGLQTYSGICVYQAEISLQKEAASHLSATELSAGELLTVTVTNPAAEETLRVVTEMGDAGAFVKVSEGTYQCLVAAKQPGTHTVTVRCAGYRLDYEVTVHPRAAKTPIERHYPLYESGEELHRFENLTRYFGGIATPERYWVGAFAAPMEGEPSVDFDGAFTEAPILTQGALWWNEKDDATVSAVNTGVVVYAGGTDLSGLTVVVDHGLGLYSWYFGLSELLVYQGEVVVTGDPIGVILPTEGEEQWTGLQMTLSGTVLDPLPLFEQSLLE